MILAMECRFGYGGDPEIRTGFIRVAASNRDEAETAMRDTFDRCRLENETYLRGDGFFVHEEKDFETEQVTWKASVRFSVTSAIGPVHEPDAAFEPVRYLGLPALRGAPA